MGPDRSGRAASRRPGSASPRDPAAGGVERAAEDRELRADARDARQDARDVEQDARQEGLDARAAELAGDDAASTAHRGLLPPRQREILGMIASGMSNKAIASQLFISLNTVKTNIRSLYANIGVVSRTQAVRWFEHGPRDRGDRGDRGDEG